MEAELDAACYSVRFGVSCSCLLSRLGLRFLVTPKEGALSCGTAVVGVGVAVN